MQLRQAILERRSIRKFLPTPVPRKKIEDILTLSFRAPSWGNTQPWEILIVSGKMANQIGDALCAKAEQGAKFNSDFEMPETFPEPYMTRYRQLAKEMYSLLDIKRDDREGRFRHYL